MKRMTLAEALVVYLPEWGPIWAREMTAAANEEMNMKPKPKPKPQRPKPPVY